MTLPRTVADVVTEDVTFEVECIDRMYLNVYVPQLQDAAGIVGYVHRQPGLPIASTAPLAKVTDAFSTAVRRFAADQGVPWVDFVKGQRKDDVMHQHLAEFEPRAAPKGCCSSAARRSEGRRHRMEFKLIEAAQHRWRAVNAPHLVALVRAGATFEKGKLVEREASDHQDDANMPATQAA